jgi:hypothetical protein
MTQAIHATNTATLNAESTGKTILLRRPRFAGHLVGERGDHATAV